jgi:hypothetical protein
MTTDTQTRQLVSAYRAARDAGDAQAAAGYLAPGFSVQSPLMRLDDPDLYLAATSRSRKVVTRTDLISELYGEGEATLLYDFHATIPGKTQRTAEHFRLAGGKIASILLIFDASPWRSG